MPWQPVQLRPSCPPAANVIAGTASKRIKIPKNLDITIRLLLFRIFGYYTPKLLYNHINYLNQLINNLYLHFGFWVVYSFQLICIAAVLFIDIKWLFYLNASFPFFNGLQQNHLCFRC